MSASRIGVTGANGYVGSRVSTRLVNDGDEVVALARSAAPGGHFVRWSLGDETPAEFFRTHRITALVHCAYDFSAVSWKEIERSNVRGSIQLLAGARAAGIPTVVVSTISAFPGCRSLYGKAKLEIEKAAAAAGAIVIRPGLVWGESAGGMFGALQKRAHTAGLVPLIGSGDYLQYLVHEDDLCALIGQCVRGSIQAAEPITAAAERGWKFRDLIAHLAAQHKRRPTFVPVPWRAIWAGLRAAELAGLKLGFRSDSVVSLVYQNPRPDFSVAKRLGLQFRDLV